MDDKMGHEQCVAFGKSLKRFGEILQTARSGSETAAIISEVLKIMRGFKVMGRAYADQLVKKVQEVRILQKEKQLLECKVEQLSSMVSGKPTVLKDTSNVDLSNAVRTEEQAKFQGKLKDGTVLVSLHFKCEEDLNKREVELAKLREAYTARTFVSVQNFCLVTEMMLPTFVLLLRNGAIRVKISLSLLPSWNIIIEVYFHVFSTLLNPQESMELLSGLLRPSDAASLQPVKLQARHTIVVVSSRMDTVGVRSGYRVAPLEIRLYIAKFKCGQRHIHEAPFHYYQVLLDSVTRQEASKTFQALVQDIVKIARNPNDGCKSCRLKPLCVESSEFFFPGCYNHLTYSWSSRSQIRVAFLFSSDPIHLFFPHSLL